MNEFIVWNIGYKKFGDNFSITQKGDLIWAGNNVCSGSYTIHFYIGKTDIEGKKIYADCSIVEYRNYFNDTNEKGYFTYDKSTLCYKIHNLSEDRMKPFIYMDSFKVIGTLQEDKHLLEARE